MMQRLAGGIRAAARASALVASLAIGALAISQAPPMAPEGAAVARDIPYVLVLACIIATLVAWRRPVPGGALLVITGLVFGVALAGRTSEVTAMAVALLYVIPGVLFLVHWAGQRPVWLQVAVSSAVVAIGVFGGVAAQATHQHVFGPAHPQSAIETQPYGGVEWAWSGGVTSTGAVVNARVTDGDRARLVVSKDPAFTPALLSAPATVEGGQDGIVSLRIEGLEPATRYYYALEVDGVLDTLRTGSLHTFPEGTSTFSVLVSSCARTGSNGLVFEAMAEEKALLYVIPGDFHYENIALNDAAAFRRAFGKQLTSPAQALLYQQTPVAYIWDDHDFGGNDSNGKSAASAAARLTYREAVPHYALPAGEGDAPIYQAFTVGRVRFVMTDTRSMRDLESMADGTPSLLGAVQRGWLKQELLQGSRDHQLVVWVSSVPWIAPAAAGRDDWGGYGSERAEIANFIAAHGITNLIMLSGDAHMLGIDDGTNSDYSDGGRAGFPVMQAGALDRPGSVKGGPYSHGAYPGGGQYGLVTFRDEGDALVVEMSGRNWLREEIVRYVFTVPQPAAVVAGAN